MIALSFRADRSGIEEWSELGSRDMDGQADAERVGSERVNLLLLIKRRLDGARHDNALF